jgi:hypothetical protein
MAVSLSGIDFGAGTWGIGSDPPVNPAMRSIERHIHIRHFAN